MGYFYADDYPNKKVYDVYSSISIGSDADLQIDDEDFKEFSPQKNSPSPLERRRQRNKGSFQPLLANDDLAKDRIRPIRKSHSFAPSNTERKEIYLISDNIEDAEIIRPSNLVRASSQPAQINLNEDVQNIEDIQIVTFEEIMRNDKLTALYVIVYHIKGQKFVTKRSYSEFDNLYKEIKRFDKNAPLPPMPSKKVLSSKTEGVKVDRIEVFDKILKILVTKKIGLKCLSEFLQTPDRLSFYGRLVPSRKSKSSPGEDVLQTPVLNRISDKPGGNEGINKYRVTGGKILKGTDNMINYQIKIIENESQSEITIIKRHKEFREFHGQLTENSDKRFKSQIPNLPDKLKVGPSSEDPKAIIEYRRAMLPRYLQTILNNPVLNGNPAILEFLKDAK